MKRISPFSFSSREGTADRGARSETVDCTRARPAPEGWTRGGEERIPVLEVGMGVGYFVKETGPSGPLRAPRFEGLGRPGEEEGSKGGSKEGAGRFLGPSRLDEEIGGRAGSVNPVSSVDFTGEELMAFWLGYYRRRA